MRAIPTDDRARLSRAAITLPPPPPSAVPPTVSIQGTTRSNSDLIATVVQTHAPTRVGSRNPFAETQFLFFFFFFLFLHRETIDLGLGSYYSFDGTKQ